MNLENYADIDKDFVSEFFRIDFGHLWWVISDIVWKRRYKQWLSAFEDYKNLDYKGLRLFSLGVCTVILCIISTIYVILSYFFVIESRKNNHLHYCEYEKLKGQTFSSHK